MAEGFKVMARLFTPAELQPIDDAFEEYDLIDAYLSGNESAGNRVMGAWAMSLLKKALRRTPVYFQESHEADIAVAVLLGMMHSFTKWKRSKAEINGVRFGTFAQFYVHNEVRTLTTSSRFAVAVPDSSRVDTMLNRVRLFSQNGNTLEEIVEAVATNEFSKSKRVIRALAELTLSYDVSLNSPIDNGESESGSVGEIFGSTMETPEDMVGDGEELLYRQKVLDEGMKILTPRERHIITERWLKSGDEEVATFDNLSQAYKLSRERIRQIQERAIKKLKRFAAGYQLSTPILR